MIVSRRAYNELNHQLERCLELVDVANTQTVKALLVIDERNAIIRALRIENERLRTRLTKGE